MKKTFLHLIAAAFLCGATARAGNWLAVSNMPSGQTFTLTDDSTGVVYFDSTADGGYVPGTFLNLSTLFASDSDILANGADLYALYGGVLGPVYPADNTLVDMHGSGQEVDWTETYLGSDFTPASVPEPDSGSLLVFLTGFALGSTWAGTGFIFRLVRRTAHQNPEI
jgi:hypothetical protein